MQSTVAIAIVLATSVAVAAPVRAAAFLVTAIGDIVLSVPGSPNPVAGLGFGTGSRFTGSWRIDLGAGTAVDRVSPGLVDPARFYAFSVSRGQVSIASATGITTLRQNPASFGAVIVLDNARLASPAPPALRLDQVSLTDGARFDAAFVPVYDLVGEVPADAFLRSLNLGVSRTGSEAAPPMLVTSVDRPDFAALLQSNSRFLSFTIGAGTPASTTGIAAAPASAFSVVNPTLFFAAIPEPTSWALLVAGFGLVGVALRRRAATPPVTTAV